jgi:hypothetical protein
LQKLDLRSVYARLSLFTHRFFIVGSYVGGKARHDTPSSRYPHQRQALNLTNNFSTRQKALAAEKRIEQAGALLEAARNRRLGA